MSDYYPPSSQAPTMQQTPPDSPSMKDKASDVKSEGKQAAGQLAQTATEHAHEVKDETARQVRDLAGEARQQLTSQVGQQHRSLVTNMRSLSSELGTMADKGSEESGVATELVGQARDRIDGLADWLDGREPGQILDEVRSYARRRPGMFLVGALAAGVVAGRLTRGVVAAHTSDDASSLGGTAPQPSMPADAITGESAAVAGYSSGGQYAQPGFEPQPGNAPGYGATSTYGDDASAPYGAPAYGEVPPTQDLPTGGAWR